MRDKYATDICTFIDDFVEKTELGKPFRLVEHQRELLRAAFRFDEAGQLSWETILIGALKKSGKTLLNSLITAWWAFTQEPPNEIFILANDEEQAVGRVFRSLAGIIKNNPKLRVSAEILAREIRLTNGTVVTALPSDYAGSAGSNHGLTSWDELWAYTSESSLRLFEELTPVPTRNNSIRVITTTAGWEGESQLLFELYKRGVSTEEHREGKGERLHPSFPIYANRRARLFTYWDHEARMPWQTPEYYDGQRQSLRPGTYIRLHENRWTTAESVFITPEIYDPCVVLKGRMLAAARRPPIFIGVDIGLRDDNAAIACVHWFRGGEQLILADHMIWRPSKAEPLDLELTVEAWLRAFTKRHRVRAIYCDPWQAHRSVTTLRKAGLPIKEFPQTQANTIQMGQTLFELLRSERLALYPSEELREQVMNAVAIESARGFRLSKERASKKIDVVVALAMACCAAVDALEKTSGGWTWPSDHRSSLDGELVARKITRWETLDDLTKREAFEMVCIDCDRIIQSHPHRVPLSEILRDCVQHSVTRSQGNKRRGVMYVQCQKCASDRADSQEGSIIVHDRRRRESSLLTAAKQGRVEIHEFKILL